MSSSVSICSAASRRPSSISPIPATAASTASGRSTRVKSGTTSAAPSPRRNDVGWICIVDLLVCGAFYGPSGGVIVAFQLRAFDGSALRSHNVLSHDVLEGVVSDAKTSHESHTPGHVLDAHDEHAGRSARARGHSHHAPGRGGPVG